MDSIEGREKEALVIILNGPGCNWAKRSGCTMCGYSNDVVCKEFKDGDMAHQIDKGLKALEEGKYVKIFTSGSFLDPQEIPISDRNAILEKVHDTDQTIRLLMETRPEFVKDEVLDDMKSIHRNLEIAIGLETSSDRIRAHVINKGFSFENYRKAAESIVNKGLMLKTYLLLKPPILGEFHSVEDCVRSINDVSELFPGSRISVNPMNIQRNTPVEDLYKRNLYTPPWLRSLVSVLKRGADKLGGKNHIMTSPTGAGKRRGAHNCGVCDRNIIDKVKQFSIHNDTSVLKIDQECCIDNWKNMMDISRTSPLAPESKDIRDEIYRSN